MSPFWARRKHLGPLLERVNYTYYTMNEEYSEFNLVLIPPNYEKILFGLPYFREARLFKYKLYKLQQQVFNPENIPKKKKSSLYQVSLLHLELWIETSFVECFDQPSFASLEFARSRAMQDNLPFSDACNVHFDNNTIATAPIKAHATLTEISHIGTNLYDDKNLPDVWARQSRDKFKKHYKDTQYSLWRWLLEILLRLANLLLNYTVTTESLIKYLWIKLFRWSLFPLLRKEDERTPLSYRSVLINSSCGGFVEEYEQFFTFISYFLFSHFSPSLVLFVVVLR